MDTFKKYFFASLGIISAVVGVVFVLFLAIFLFVAILDGDFVRWF